MFRLKLFPELFHFRHRQHLDRVRFFSLAQGLTQWTLSKTVDDTGFRGGSYSIFSIDSTLIGFASLQRFIMRSC